MPTYRYRCLDCEDEFEQTEHIEDHGGARPECPGCGSKRVEQVFSSFFAKTTKKS